MSILRPLRAESLSAQVAETIRSAISNQELRPGQPLRELALAKSLKVSQATVREALAQLEAYGLVVRTPNRSTAVSRLEPAEVQQRLAVRLSLEQVACRQAALSASLEDITALEGLCLRTAEAVQSGDVKARRTAERAFFQRLWVTARNPVLYRILDQLTTPLYALVPDNESPDMTRLVPAILETVRRRNTDSIGQLMEREWHRMKPVSEAVV